MSWFILTLSCIILWSVTDILYKKSLNYTDPLSQYKSFIWIGMAMAFAGVIMVFCSKTLPDSIMMVKDNLYLIPLCILYTIALFFGLLGAKHLDASVVSPLENIDGAIAAIVLYFFFLFTDRNHITDKIGPVQIIGTAAIVVGVVLLGIQEQKLANEEMGLGQDKKKHRLGVWALLFPIVYNIVDAASMVAIGITVSEETEVAIPDIDFFIFESAGFFVVAVFMWLYMLMVKKYKYNPFRKEESLRCAAAAGETLGTMTYIFAVAGNPVLTAPITSSYCLVTIVLARIFLKERLTRKQYLSLAFVVMGIALLGICEVFGA